MCIHYGFNIFIKCGGSQINRSQQTNKKFLYENEVKNDWNYFNVIKQIFIFLFSTCKLVRLLK